MFPDRVNTEVRGEVSLTLIASSAWMGPRVDDGDWRRGASGEYNRGWMREEPTAWDRLKAEHDSSFADERPGEFRGR